MEKFLNPRKRRREDLSCELASLTKRFRDLSLSPVEDGCNSIGGFYNNQKKDDYKGAAKCTGCTASAHNVYNPELGIENNPFYYEMNRVLYDLHVERVKRSCHCAVHAGCGQILTDDFKTAVELQTRKATKLQS